MSVLRSRDNPRLRRWQKLARDARARKAEKRALIEGPHLLAALLNRGLSPVEVLVSESALADGEIASLVARAGRQPSVLSDSLFRAVADARTPQGVAAEIAIPQGSGNPPRQVFLEGIQDAGNVGAILRSAAAFGIGRVVLDAACADPWSPKVLRAGMGGHFALAIEEGADLDAEAAAFSGAVLCTASRGGTPLDQADLSGRVAWIFGNEGRGVSDRLQALATARVTIALAPGAESLNVAAAAAICLCAGFSKPGAGS